jgi:hypothetical protein
VSEAELLVAYRGGAVSAQSTIDLRYAPQFSRRDILRLIATRLLPSRTAGQPGLPPRGLPG